MMILDTEKSQIFEVSRAPKISIKIEETKNEIVAQKLQLP